MKPQLGFRLDGDGPVAGVDEAGRGPLAGPVFAAAVILGHTHGIKGLGDSKQLAASERERLFVEIQQRALAWALGTADVAEIDALNILEATHLAMRRALLGLALAPRHVRVDGNRCPSFAELGFFCTFEYIIQGDATDSSISAASIIAKVARDRWMREADMRYPGYGFAVHKGYGTAAHQRALNLQGPCALHRCSFEPVKSRLHLAAARQ
jgi:ribonuclease HII